MPPNVLRFCCGAPLDSNMNEPEPERAGTSKRWLGGCHSSFEPTRLGAISSMQRTRETLPAPDGLSPDAVPAPLPTSGTSQAAEVDKGSIGSSSPEPDA